MLPVNRFFKSGVKILDLLLFLGGGFPLPPAASQLCGMLPPPHCFHGPFVIVDPVMELIKHLNINETGKLVIFTF